MVFYCANYYASPPCHNNVDDFAETCRNCVEAGRGSTSVASAANVTGAAVVVTGSNSAPATIRLETGCPTKSGVAAGSMVFSAGVRT